MILALFYGVALNESCRSHATNGKSHSEMSGIFVLRHIVQACLQTICLKTNKHSRKAVLLCCLSTWWFNSIISYRLNRLEYTVNRGFIAVILSCEHNSDHTLGSLAVENIVVSAGTVFIADIAIAESDRIQSLIIFLTVKLKVLNTIISF